MSEPNEQVEPVEPTVTEVPEPDQEPHEPTPDEADDQDEDEAEAAENGSQEPAEAPEQEASMTPEQREKAYKKIASSFQTYTAAVQRNLEEDANDLLPCPLCPSTHPAFVNINDAGRVPDFVQEPVMKFLGLAREQDYEPDPETEVCRSCKGKTKTKTGAVSGSFVTRPCPTCNAFGYTINGQPPNVQQVQTNGQVESPAEHVGPLDTSEVDAWGEPKILPDGRPNPNYGKMPQFKETDPVYGVTANLSAQDVISS